ncbi:MAG TPA: GNAT family N-acyltransferase [Gammaproteobacteria bacterium]|nr:GNAT family N-acyltransferase [Gammaproteobacteria bacterium]
MFFLKSVDDDTERELEERLRFQVYCTEKRWLNPDDYPNGRESDQFDIHSDRFVAISMSGEAAGTMRLIRGGAYKLPVQEYFGVELPTDANCSELSRLTVAQAYRGTEHAIMLGLCRVVYETGVRTGVDIAYSIMEEALFRLLKFVGFPFQQIGDAQQTWGAYTAPYMCYTSEIVPSLKKRDETTGLAIGDYFAEEFDPLVRG